jgi:hypothetical protein
MYTLIRTDTAGNTTSLIESSDFQIVYNCASRIKTSPKQYTYKIIDPERITASCLDGLDNIERELAHYYLGG